MLPPCVCLAGCCVGWCVGLAEAGAAVITVQSAVSRHHPAQLAPVATEILHTGALVPLDCL